MRRARATVSGFKGLQADILVELKKVQPRTVKELARQFQVTPNALRRHLKVLETAGAIQYRTEVRGVGGPVFAYSLSERGEALFPRSYAPVLAEALAVVHAEHGIDGVVQLFRRQWQALSAEARPAVASLPATARAAHLAELRTRQGYMAESEMQSATEGRIREHNCAIREVAQQFPEVCEAESMFFAEVLGAVVERQGHILTGCNACEYLVHFPEDGDAQTHSQTHSQPHSATHLHAPALVHPTVSTTVKANHA
jgi:DeoR family suf operon transcriptional repressor